MNNVVTRAAHRAAYLALKSVGLRGGEVMVEVTDSDYSDQGWLLTAYDGWGKELRAVDGLNEVPVSADDVDGWDRLLVSKGLRLIEKRGDWYHENEHSWLAMYLAR